MVRPSRIIKFVEKDFVDGHTRWAKSTLAAMFCCCCDSEEKRRRRLRSGGSTLLLVATAEEGEDGRDATAGTYRPPPTSQPPPSLEALQQAADQAHLRRIDVQQRAAAKTKAASETKENWDEEDGGGSSSDLPFYGASSAPVSQRLLNIYGGDLSNGPTHNTFSDEEDDADDGNSESDGKEDEIAGEEKAGSLEAAEGPTATGTVGEAASQRLLTIYKGDLSKGPTHNTFSDEEEEDDTEDGSSDSNVKEFEEEEGAVAAGTRGPKEHVHDGLPEEQHYGGQTEEAAGQATSTEGGAGLPIWAGSFGQDDRTSKTDSAEACAEELRANDAEMTINRDERMGGGDTYCDDERDGKEDGPAPAGASDRTGTTLDESYGQPGTGARWLENWANADDIPPSNSTEKEMAQITELRAALLAAKGRSEPPAKGESWTRPFYLQGGLCRFLRGRGGDVKEATKMIVDTVEWFEGFGLEARLRSFEKAPQWKRDLMRKWAGGGVFGKDKRGASVMVLKQAVIDLGGMLREVGDEFYIDHEIYNAVLYVLVEGSGLMWCVCVCVCVCVCGSLQRYM